MTEKSKRILIFTTAYKPFVGGSEMAIENISRRLPSIFFDIVTPRHSRKLEKFTENENIRVHRVGFGWSSDKYFFPISGFLKTFSLMKKNDYYLFHAYQASYGAGAAWLLKVFKPKIKFLLTIQEGEDLNKQNFWVRFFRSLIVGKADMITSISNYLADYVKSINEKAKVVIIPNGVDIENFSLKGIEDGRQALLKEKIGLKEDNRVIITVSRLVSKNCLDNLITAVAKVKSQLPEIKLLIIGNGPLLKKLKLISERLNLNNSVLFLGEISHENLPEYLKIADVFIRPSKSEGLGNSFLEAMATGVPIIGTPVGGIPDFLADRQTGLFCRVGDSDDLAEKTMEVLTDKNLRIKIINNARLLIEEKYNWEIIARKFESIYTYGI